MRLVLAVALIALWTTQARPIVLSESDIGDTYDELPADLQSVRSWLGLYEAARGAHTVSRLAPASVRFVKSTERGGGWNLRTDPANASLLLAGVDNIMPGAAVTAAQELTLWQNEREVEIRMGANTYTIRLLSRESDHCDGSVSIALAAVTQTLFDLRNLPVERTCDDPHFRIQWAGDIDRDGRLDLLTTLSEKYSYHPRQLFLSTAARSGNLVAQVAQYDRVAR